jgi:hypothetical protein
MLNKNFIQKRVKPVRYFQQTRLPPERFYHKIKKYWCHVSRGGLLSMLNQPFASYQMITLSQNFPLEPWGVSLPV